MQKVLVTGGAGFIGQNLCQQLLSISNEIQVYAIDNLSTGRLINVEPLLSNPRFHFFQGDIRDEVLVDAIMQKGIDTVFHLAAVADIVPSIVNPESYFESNVDGTFKLLEVVRKYPLKKFLYAASSSCYGIPDHYPTAETAEIRTLYPYAQTKWMAETLVMHWGKVYQLPVISLRLFNVYGPKSRTSGTYGAVFGVFLAQKLANLPFTVVGDGTQTRDFTFVDDVANAFITAAESSYQNEIFNVGSDNTYSVNRLIELLGGTKTYIPKRPGEPDCTFADTTKIKKYLHWKAKISLEEGVKRLLSEIDYWKEAPVWTPEKIEVATHDWFKYLGDKTKTVLVTGGAGYVGSKLVPDMLQKGYRVKVLDWFLYGETLENHPNLEMIRGDLRDETLAKESLRGVDTVIHLACISNDPSYELNPDLGKSVNYDAFIQLVHLCKKEKSIKRFIYASSSSVYGVKEEMEVTEDLSLEPLTDYSKYKALCEEYLLEQAHLPFQFVIVRPATVCGYAPRLRLDLSVNILTNHAITNKKILVFGGKQTRPNIHIQDMVNFYLLLLETPFEKIHRQIYNVGFQNYSMDEIANIVKTTLNDPAVTITHKETDDLRSYRVSSAKVKKDLGFVARYTLEDAVKDLKKAFESKLIEDSMNNNKYYNIKMMNSADSKDITCKNFSFSAATPSPVPPSSITL